MENYLDLNRKGLEKVKESVNEKSYDSARKQLREYYRTRKTDMFLMDKSVVFDFINKHPDEKTIEIADALCKNTFIFDQPWDMEKCTDKITFPEEINWSYVHNNDREWMWMLNRQNYWICLMQAYTATQNECYLNTFLYQIESWLDNETDPDGKSYTTWRTIDVGIRLKNWVKILEYIIDLEQLNDVLFEKILKSVHSQIRYLMSRYNRAYSLTNWRILEYHGALIASIYFPELKESREWIQTCIQILNECIQLQVTNDGFHWEQSYMYHVEMLLCMKDVILICGRNQIELPQTMIETTKKMADAMSHMITPMGTQPCYGDSDAEDLRELMSGLAVLFENEQYFYLGQGCTTVNLVCDYGDWFLEMVRKMKGQIPECTDYAHSDVGNYFARSGWGEEDSYLFFKNGFLGSGHGHCDLLHMEIVSKGNPILVDSGRYTYRDNTTERQTFKSGRAHNTLLVDGKEFIIQEGSWDNQKTASVIKRPPVLNEPVCYLQGAHMGYMDMGVLVNRKIIYIKPDIWVVTDECFADAPHVYEQRYHFAADSLEIQDSGVIYKDEKQVFQMAVMQDSRIEKEIIEISPSYNYKYTSGGISVKTEGTGSTYMTTIFTSGKKEDEYHISSVNVYDMYKNKIDAQNVSCYKLTSGTDEWIVLTNHMEENNRRQVYITEDILVFGKTAVLHKSGTTVEKYILEY